MYLHREGKYHIIIACIVFFLLQWMFIRLFGANSIVYYLVLIPCLLLLIWVFWFFRIPRRTFTPDERFAFAPCDGKVVVIEETEENEYFKDRRLQVSIFMSPLNVHVNRYPISGQVQYVQYHPGKYLVAWHPKSSTENERTTIVIQNNRTAILVRQIAGALARRIVCYSKEKEEIIQHNELGFIKFGSRVDVFFPIGTEIIPKIGDDIKGGIHKLAKL